MSITTKVDVSQLLNAKKVFRNMQIQINGELTANELLIIAERTIELARVLIPFDTGAARESLQIFVEPDGKKVIIGSDGGIRPDGVREIYLRFLELGTSKMIARPFLFPSVLQALNEFKERYPLKIRELARVSV